MNQKENFLKKAVGLQPEMQRYLKCMDEIKMRWIHINASLGNSYTKTAIEFIALQFRMITESILLGNLSSHEGYYFKTLHELAGMWHIKEILKTIENVNPNYYPIPTRFEETKVPNRTDAAGYVHFEDTTLVKEDLIKIYELCSEYLHPQNPFAKIKDYSIWQEFENWLLKIKRLLSCHTVQLVGNKKRKLLIQIDFDSPLGSAEDIKIGYMEQRE